MALGVMMTPALAVNGTNKVVGKGAECGRAQNHPSASCLKGSMKEEGGMNKAQDRSHRRADRRGGRDVAAKQTQRTKAGQVAAAR